MHFLNRFTFTCCICVCVFVSPSSSNLLPVLLLLIEGVVEVFVDDGQVAGHHGAGAALHKAKGLFLTGGVQVVEEDAADTAGLSSVPDVEVPITPGGEVV